jgi:hypothetical protein
MKEISHTVDVCACSHRGGRGVVITVHLPLFLYHLQSPCATEILEHAIENNYQRLSESFRSTGSVLPHLDTKLDCITLLDVVIHHFR